MVFGLVAILYMTSSLLAVWKAGSLSLIEEGYAVMIDELLGFGSCLALPE